jgi:PAS domain S-box-containing protein
MLGVLQDITDRRRVIEEKNQAQHDLLLADFVFQSLRPTSITDADGTILQVNNAFVKLTGYEREEIIGKNHRILNSERQDKNFYQKMWQTLLENDYWEGDLWNRHKNGGFYLENLRVMAIKNSQSQERYYIGFFQKLKESTDTPK